MTLSITAARGESLRLLEALRLLMVSTERERGCVGSQLVFSNDVSDPARISYTEVWSSEEDLRKQVRSDRFLHLLGLMESAPEPPRLEFQLAGGTRGLDYVEEVRAGLTRRIRVYRVILWWALTASSFAHANVAAAQPDRDAGVPVMYRGQEIVRIHRGAGGLGPAERARLASERLNQFVRDLDFDPARVVVNDRETFSELVYDDRILSIITDDDAAAVGRPRPEFARAVRDRLAAVIAGTREEFSPWSIVIGAAWAVLATVILGMLLRLVARLRHRVRARVEARYRRLSDPAAENVAAFWTTRVGSLVQSAIVVATAGLTVALVAVWAEVVLNVLPWSRPIARVIYRYSSAPIRTFWLGFQGVVPNLFYLAVIGLTTFVVLKIVRMFFNEIAVGHFRLAAFPDDWAEPTYKLVRTLLLAIAVVGAFPYVPGSQSPAFQGISLFLGLLVSLSASSALSNIIAGIVLTYSRAFRLGDTVRIGDTLGEVTVKRLLMTHVRTSKNVIVSIPNSLVLTAQVLNYSTLASARGLVLHTSVTIGYAAPWRQVHELLIAAAARTNGVLEDPVPFVLQKELKDFSVAYEINVFVASAVAMSHTYSALHANIRECFNDAGIEILSPNYVVALRESNQVTTPSRSDR